MVIIFGNGVGNPGSNPDKAVCISHSANITEKCIHSTTCPRALCKITKQIGMSNLDLATGRTLGKLYIKTCNSA